MPNDSHAYVAAQGPALKRIAARGTTDFEVDHNFVETLTVEATLHRRFAATRSNPAEGGVDVDTVYFRGIDITRVLDSDEIAAIAEKCK